MQAVVSLTSVSESGNRIVKLLYDG
jgi:hypothetical protein